MLVEAADTSLHPWVRAHVSAADRRSALEQELSYWLETAAQDLDYATAFAEAAPQSGEPATAYLDRWLPLQTHGYVLAGPRYLGRDPDLPFVGVSASDRPLNAADHDALLAVAAGEFAAFRPGFVLVTTADVIGAWPGTRSEMRQVVGRLADLRARDAPSALSTAACTEPAAIYERYLEIHRLHVEQEPAHARRARCEELTTLADLAQQGLLFDVLVDGQWAGILAAEADARRGVRGVTVVELMLDHPYRGRGFGPHLSTLLAKAVPLSDEQLLLGTIHADNRRAYTSALRAGRVDVGGEIILPL